MAHSDSAVTMESAGSKNVGLFENANKMYVYGIYISDGFRPEDVEVLTMNYIFVLITSGVSHRKCIES